MTTRTHEPPLDTAAPGPLDVPLDSHLHTDFSHDAKVPIDVYASLARERGLPEIAITDHLDFDRRDPNFKAGEYERRRRVAREADERWDGRPRVRFGVEITYERRLEREIREYLAGHAYDHVIGSVHISDRNPLHPTRDTASWISGKTHRDASAWYWDEAEAGIRSGLFDAFGHLDVVKRYLFRFLGRFDYQQHADLYERLLDALVGTGTALEVNSSGLRHDVGEPYPPEPVVQRFKMLGGGAVTVGSDSHLRVHFGVGVPEAYRAVARAGFEAVVLGKSRRAVDAGVERRGLEDARA